MNTLLATKKIMAVLALVSIVMAFYLIWARPYQLRWGTTDTEVNQQMPGDEINGHPSFLATRAITIQGTPEQIWPWLLQMGYGRAGFYAYDIFENIGSPRGIRSADHIIPEFQQHKVGDEMPISPAGGLFFYAIEPNQYLIWRGDGDYGGFIWALYPQDNHQTRLVSRARLSYSWNKPIQLAFDLLTEFSDHLAIRKILQGVKGRVEGNIEHMAQANTEFVIYLASALIFVGAVFLIFLRPLSWRSWLAGLAAGVAWLITWYAPIPIWIGAFLELLFL
ncbi:MAG TPA: hypothetical protein VK897_20845 [Anaerolineales bacterium]|nr:hypothetical protein [Anaerolineales bacterium]